jgi:hypothetical protein
MHESILFGQTGGGEGGGVAVFALVLFVKKIGEAAATTGLFYEIRFVVGFVEIAVCGDPVRTPERGIFTGCAFGVRFADHPWLFVLGTVAGRVTWFAVRRAGCTGFVGAYCMFDIDHVRTLMCDTESTFTTFYVEVWIYIAIIITTFFRPDINHIRKLVLCTELTLSSFYIKARL